MSIISGSIKDVLSINLKHRHDSFTDQFSRIFMVKMLIISSLITSIEFFNDKVSCILPTTSSMAPEFAHSACWIRGFYIYAELFHRMKESGYYGMPKDVEVNGIRKDGSLCRMISKQTGVKDYSCHPMTKTYFAHYQYFPFYIASLAVLYYLPYIFFRMVNNDVLSLKAEIKPSLTEKDTERISSCYFSKESNGGVLVLRLRVLGSIFSKALYVLVNIGGFIFTNKILHNKFLGYGLDWIAWSRLNNSVAFDYNGHRNFPKPGNHLLPTMGFCDIAEGANDRVSVLTNNYRIICEISTHVLYQYVLIVLWFLFIVSIVISSLGFGYILINYGLMCFNVVLTSLHGRFQVYRACKNLTVREIEYFKYIREKNISLYRDVFYQVQTGLV